MPAVLSSGFKLLDIDPSITTDELSDATVLSNGRIVLVGEQFSTTGDIQMRQFSATGSALGTTQRVNTTTFDLQAGAKVTQLAGGNIVVAWTDESATTPDFSGQTVRMQVYTSAGVKIGGEITVPTVTADDQSVETIVALKDGRFAVFWQDNSSFPQTKFRIYFASGTAATGEMTVTNLFHEDREGFAATYGTGGMIVSGVYNSGGGHVGLQRYNSNGTANGALIDVAQGTGLSDTKVARLTNDTYVVTWTDSSNTPPFNKGPVVYGQIVDAAGNKVGGKFAVSDDIFSEHRQSEITALSDGRFVVTWRMEPDNDFIGYKTVTRVFNADGSADSDVLIVYDNSEAYGNIRNFASIRSITEMADGRLLYTFNALNPNATFTAATRILDPRDALDKTLTDGNETFTGTGFADKIRGRGGNDTIMGDNGNDTISGDDGNDVLFGQSGNDWMNGGNGADRLTGGSGSDTILGGSGDGAADDFIYASTTESRAGATTRDHLYYFELGIDDIDLRQIDANTTLANNQAFAYSGTTAAAFSVWQVDTGADVLIRADTNGDKIADLEIVIHNSNLLSAGDFLL